MWGYVLTSFLGSVHWVNYYVDYLRVDMTITVRFKFMKCR